MAEEPPPAPLVAPDAHHSGVHQTQGDGVRDALLVTYEYVEPYHHANTTKHGASNWSWTKLWKEVHDPLPIPLCCPCANDPQNGDRPHVMDRVVGAHVKLTQPGNEEAIPAIIPACNGCNRADRALHWNSKAILLRKDIYFFGKLYLLEQKTGPYWEEVHDVRHVRENDKGYTYVKGKVQGEPLAFGSMKKPALVTSYLQDLITYYSDLGPEEIKTADDIINKKYEPYTVRNIKKIICDLYGAGTKRVGVATGLGREFNQNHALSTAFIQRSPLNKDFVETLQTIDGEWKYDDGTQFVYDLLRPAEKENVILTCKHIMGSDNNFTQDVIDQVPGVEAGPEEERRMPDIQEQIIDNFLNQVKQHGLLQHVVQEQIQDILTSLAERITDMMRELVLNEQGADQ